MTDDRANIKVSRETFEVLEVDKPDGVTWDYYLTQLYHTSDYVEADSE